MRPQEFNQTSLRDILLYRQVQQRREWRETRRHLMLRNELRATSMAEDPDFIDIPGMDNQFGSSRDEEAIEELEERYSDWIDEHTAED